MPNIRVKKRLFAKKTKNMKEGAYKDLALDFQRLENYYIEFYKLATYAKRLGKNPSKKITVQQQNKFCNDYKKLNDLIKDKFNTTNGGTDPRTMILNILNLESINGNPIVDPPPTEIEEN